MKTITTALPNLPATAMNKHHSPLRTLSLLALLATASTSPASTIIANLVYTDQGDGSYLYELTITNDCPEDVFTFDFTDVPANDSILGPSLTIPMGFDGDYDASTPALGFFGDSELFMAGETYSGFSFLSNAAPNTAFTMFQASTFADDITGSVTISPVPEPSSSLLAGLVFGASILLRRRPA
ncbi:PEP-CTERM sorting domain-containing protein [Roseibacillus ishigakijimensis]|uniref:PEP-CTERM sorting domain-containing protein n=1 Tax=Roseibacillus ishigakijimensis TaxID=454146 RepID=A0A934RPE8_9BACT|nr:PEP-CTERM sorting domain-containing protein [Roseibacillus ishigakijimensis]MBK1834533.1 PEP-CTERM sorting domain-containing protein [Roseibacillus ishigakijimensis]